MTSLQLFLIMVVSLSYVWMARRWMVENSGRPMHFGLLVSYMVVIEVGLIALSTLVWANFAIQGYVTPDIMLGCLGLLMASVGFYSAVTIPFRISAFPPQSAVLLIAFIVANIVLGIMVGQQAVERILA